MPAELDRLVEALAEAISKRTLPGTRRWATVDAVNVGPPASVDIELGGVIVPAVRYESWYTPSPGDVVIVEIVEADPVVRGTLA